MTFLKFTVFALTLFTIQACAPLSKTTIGTSTEHNSMQSLDWSGTYTGVMPCADCEGLETIITLKQDKTYSIKRKYRGKSENIREEHGLFAWNKAGSTITLKGQNPSDFVVGENKLTQLDVHGKVITGNLSDRHILKKEKEGITDKYWKLTELHGKAIIYYKNYKNEPYFILKSESKRITGNGGCNNFFGTYTLKENERISFSPLGMTQMACMNMDIERKFMDVLGTADSYYLKGDTLMLNRAKMATLAKFVVVYMKD